MRDAKRRARKLNAMPVWLTEEHHQQIQAIYDQRSDLTEEHGIAYDVDHIVPLQNPYVCGLHVPWNLQILTSTENQQKSNNFRVEDAEPDTELVF